MRKFLIISSLAIVAFACNRSMDGADTDLSGIPYSPETYVIMKPANFPEVPVPADNPMTVAGVQLGRRLFYDPILSADSTMSCSSCHLPAGSFTDNLATSKGIDGISGKRSSMGLLNIAYSTNGLFWDGRSPSLEDQALRPVEDPIELHAMWPNVVEKLKNHPTYPRFFREAFGILSKKEITKELAAKAIAQFERILISSGQSKYDLNKKDPFIFDDDEYYGLDVYMNRVVSRADGGCFHCHDGGADLFNSNDYFNNGIEKNVANYTEFPDKGLGAVTGNITDNGKFRAPGLRNIMLTAPYMHDGRFKTIEEVVDHYGSGGTYSPGMNPFIQQVGFPKAGGTWTGLTADDKKYLIKFLHTLTDTAFINNPDIKSPF